MVINEDWHDMAINIRILAELVVGYAISFDNAYSKNYLNCAMSV